jgi:hypothetical protein
MSDNLGSTYDPKKMAILAKSAEIYANRQWSSNKKTCWSCQKDKQILGGHQKVTSGFYKFVCKDCCEENLQKKKDAA